MGRHPTLLAGLAVTLFGIVSLPAQYTPVLFDHDAEFVMLACAALAPATAIAAYRDGRRRPDGHVRRALIAGGVGARHHREHWLPTVGLWSAS